MSRMGVVDCYRNRLSWSFGRVGIAQRFRPWDSYPAHGSSDNCYDILIDNPIARPSNNMLALGIKGIEYTVLRMGYVFGHSIPQCTLSQDICNTIKRLNQIHIIDLNF